MKKLIVLIVAVLTAGCTSTLYTRQPPSGNAEMVGTMTLKMFEPNQIEVTLDGKNYRGEWKSGAGSAEMPVVNRPHKRNVGIAHGVLTAEDGSRLRCTWLFQGGEGKGTCIGPGAREYKLTTQ